MAVSFYKSGPVHVPANRGRRLIEKRERRKAERELNRAKRRLTDFVLLWAEGLLDRRPQHEFFVARDRLVREYHVALARVGRQSGLEVMDA